jgi:hypothetical protein
VQKYSFTGNHFKSYAANIKSRFPAINLIFSLMGGFIMFSFAHGMFCLAEDTTRSVFQPLLKTGKSAHISLWLSSIEILFS